MTSYDRITGVAMMKIFRLCSIAALLLVLFSACGRDEPEETAYASINIQFAPSAPHQDVTKVVVNIAMPDGESFEKELDIDGNKATGAVAVPIGTTITVTVNAYEGDEVLYTGSEEVYVDPAASDLFPVNIRLSRMSNENEFDVDIEGLVDNQTVNERTQTISGRVPESIAGNVDHARIHLINPQTGGIEETRLMNVNPDGSFSQDIVLASGDNTIWVEFEDANNNVIGSTERITLDAEIPVMDLKIILTWDTQTDLDLHVIDPNGEECYFMHMTTAIGGSLDIDDLNGYGPETFTLQNAIPGEYIIKVVAYWLGFANEVANATVKVFKKDRPAGVFGPYRFSETDEEWEIPEKIRI